jgi:DNA-binding MarR family transcriptional regulator
MDKFDTGKKTAAKGKGVTAPLKILPALTDRQSKCLLFIFNYYAERRHFPTHREIANEMGIRSTTAAMYLDPLVEKGYLKRAGKGKVARNLRITVDGLERLRMLGVTVQS